MSRRNQILVAVLAVQLVLVAIFFWPRSTTLATAGEPFFDKLDQVVQITVRDGDGHEIRLNKKDDVWVLPDIGDYLVQANKASQFLDKVGQFKTDRVIAQTVSSHKRLGVAEDAYERQVLLEWADGTQHILYLGTSPSYGVIHARADKENRVYLVSGLSTTDVGATASAWVDTTYLTIPADQIVAVKLENANGTFEFTKDADGKWLLAGLAEGETLNENNVTSLINRVSSLRLTEPLGKEDKPEYGLQSPAATVTVQTQGQDGNAQTWTLRVGAKDDETYSYIVRSSESPYAVRVADYAVKDFVEKTRADFLQVPSTPTPKPPA